MNKSLLPPSVALCLLLGACCTTPPLPASRPLPTPPAFLMQEPEVLKILPPLRRLPTITPSAGDTPSK